MMDWQLDIQVGEDIIRWGRIEDANFSVRSEAYISTMGIREDQRRQI